MKSTHVSIACQACGGRVTVPAFTETGVVGLAVNRMHAHGGSRVERAIAQAWVITHLTSGLVLGAGYARRDQAEHALRLLGGLDVDWTLPVDRLQDPALIAVMIGIVEEAHGLDTGLDL